MPKTLPNQLKAFESRNFVYYFAGASISQTGTWMQNVSMPLLCLKLTASPALAGVVAGAEFLPSIFISLFAGAFIDRLKNEKLILYITQSVMLFCALFIGLCVFFDFMSFVLLLVLAFIYGIFSAVDSTAKYSLTPAIVEKNQIANASALMSVAGGVVKIAGPSLAGITLAAFGLGACFLANALSFVAMIVALLLIKPRKIAQEKKQSILQSIKLSLLYIKNHKVLLTPLVIFFIASICIPNYAISISALVRFALGGGDDDFGYVMSFLGVGALMGGLLNTTHKPRVPIRSLYFSVITSAICLFGSGMANGYLVLGFCLAGTSLAFVITQNIVSIYLQSYTRAKFRGRVMSVLILIYFGTAPFGMYLAGLLASVFGARLGVFISSGGCLVAIFALIIYKKLSSKSQ